jgi:predicted transcriptional regulator
MNAVKEKAAEVGELIRELQDNSSLDQRWVAIAKTDLQKGFMAATRSIAKPDFF